MPESLIQSIAELLDESTKLRADIKGLMRRMRVGELLLVVCVAALVLGAIAIWRTQTIIADRQAERTEQLYSACVQFNVQQQGDRASAVNSLLALLPPEVPLTAEQQIQLKAYQAAVEKDQPFRDCSTAGIHEYLTNPPEDPARR